METKITKYLHSWVFDKDTTLTFTNDSSNVEKATDDVILVLEHTLNTDLNSSIKTIEESALYDNIILKLWALRNKKFTHNVTDLNEYNNVKLTSIGLISYSFSFDVKINDKRCH